MRKHDLNAASRARAAIDAIGRRIAAIAQQPEKDRSGARPRPDYVRAVRAALGFEDRPVIRVAYDDDAAILGLVHQLHGLVRAAADDDPKIAAIATRLASLLSKRPLDEETEAEVSRFENVPDDRE